MEMKISCPSCDQHIAIDSEAGGSTILCPGCNTAVPVPRLVSNPARPAAVPPRTTQPQIVYAPAKPKSIAWGIFWGLFLFFIVLPLVGLAVFIMVPAFMHGRAEAQKRVAAIELSRQATNNAERGTLRPGSITPVESRKPNALLKISELDRRYFEISKDEIRGLTFIKSKYAGPPTTTGCSLYISHDDKTWPTLVLACMYVNEDALYFNKVLFRTGDDTLHKLEILSPQFDSERLGDCFYLAEQLVISAPDAPSIAALVACTNGITMRYQEAMGNDYHDFKLSPQQVAAMRSVYSVWNRMGGSEGL